MTTADASAESLRARTEELLDGHGLEEAGGVLSTLIDVGPDNPWSYLGGRAGRRRPGAGAGSVPLPCWALQAHLAARAGDNDMAVTAASRADRP